MNYATGIRFQESGVGKHETAVFLVTRNSFPNRGQGFAFELPKIPVFLNLGVVDKPMMPAPLG